LRPRRGIGVTICGLSVIASLGGACAPRASPSGGGSGVDGGVATRTARPPRGAQLLSGTTQLRLIANDRWGNPINATWESRAYLAAALPVLRRQLTPDDFERLQAELAALPGAPGTPPDR
jgi:hypothetical protein